MRKLKKITASICLAATLMLSPVASLPTVDNTITVEAATKKITSMTSKEIASKLKSAGFPVKNIITYTSKTDPNGLLGRPNQYTSKTSFADNRLEQNPNDDPNGGTIEVFKTKADATKRKKYIESVTEGLSFLQSYIYQYDNVLIRLSYDLTPSQVKVYTTAFKAMQNGKTPTYPVTVKLNKKSATLKVNQKITLKLTGAKSKVKWTSSNKSVATVSSSGVVTAKKKGSATITATYNNKKYTCKITVKSSSNTTKPTQTKLLDVELIYFDEPLVAFEIKNTSSKTVSIDQYMMVSDDYDDYLLSLIDSDTLESITEQKIAPNKTALVYFSVVTGDPVFISDSQLLFTFHVNNTKYACLLNDSGQVLATQEVNE